MLQLIGLLLCLMLFVKGIEFIHQTQVTPRTDGAGRGLALVMCVICILGALVFGVAFLDAPMR